MRAFQQAQFVGVEAEPFPAFMQIGNAREQGGVQGNAAVMGGQLGRHLALDRLQRRIAMAGDQVGKHRPDAPQGAAAAFHRHDGVFEIGRRGGGGDRLDLGQMLGHALVEGRREMLGRDHVERRRAERGGPVGEEGVLCHGLSWPVGRCGVKAGRDRPDHAGQISAHAAAWDGAG